MQPERDVGLLRNIFAYTPCDFLHLPRPTCTNAADNLLPSDACDGNIEGVDAQHLCALTCGYACSVSPPGGLTYTVAGDPYAHYARGIRLALVDVAFRW